MHCRRLSVPPSSHFHPASISCSLDKQQDYSSTFIVAGPAILNKSVQHVPSFRHHPKCIESVYGRFQREPGEDWPWGT